MAASLGLALPLTEVQRLRAQPLIADHDEIIARSTDLLVGSEQGLRPEDLARGPRARGHHIIERLRHHPPLPARLRGIAYDTRKLYGCKTAATHLQSMGFTWAPTEGQSRRR